jgi:hypothetical protein
MMRCPSFANRPSPGFRNFAERLRIAGPVPDHVSHDPDLSRAYAEAMDEMLAPIRDKARAPAGRCVDIVVEKQVTTPAATTCTTVRDALR